MHLHTFVYMKSIKESFFYDEVLKELNLHFGNFYFFEGFVISEIKENVVFKWEYARILTHEVAEFYNTSGADIVYISNRINKYNVSPVDWLKFTFYAFKLKGYAIVVNSELENRNAKFESLFVPSKFKVFDNSLEAIQWAGTINEVRASEVI